MTKKKVADSRYHWIVAVRQRSTFRPTLMLGLHFEMACRCDWWRNVIATVNVVCSVHRLLHLLDTSVAEKSPYISPYILQCRGWHPLSSSRFRQEKEKEKEKERDRDRVSHDRDMRGGGNSGGYVKVVGYFRRIRFDSISASQRSRNIPIFSHSPHSLILNPKNPSFIRRHCTHTPPHPPPCLFSPTLSYRSHSLV